MTIKPNCQTKTVDSFVEKSKKNSIQFQNSSYFMEVDGQILEDMNQPELVGKIMVWKLPKAIFNKMTAKMNPSPESKKAPVPVMDYLIGLPLEIDVVPGPDDPKAPERRQREINYDLCDFDTEYAPIIKVDGTPLFTDEELELIDSYVTAKNDFAKAKSEAKKAAAQKAIEGLVPQIKELYKKALEYMKENSLDLEKECGFQEWDEKTTKRVQNWIEVVAPMRDPKTVTVNEAVSTPVAEEVLTDTMSDPAMEVMAESGSADDLPF